MAPLLGQEGLGVVGGRIEHLLCPPPGGQVVQMILAVLMPLSRRLRSLAGMTSRRIHKKSAAAYGPPILLVEGCAPPTSSDILACRHPRRALYMPALVAVRHEPHLRAFYCHLVERGKTKLRALVAVMRKLLHAIYGMLKHQQPLDGSKLWQLPEAISPFKATFSATEAA